MDDADAKKKNMLPLYLLSFLLGSLLLLVSFVGGGGGHSDAGEGGDVGESESDADHGGEDSEDADDASTLTWMAVAGPLLSLRFWTFFLTFGGLTGAALTWLTATPPLVPLLLALGVGVGAGLGVSKLQRWLVRSQVSSAMNGAHFLGAGGVVLLPVERGALGRVRIAFDDQIVDVDAVTDDERALEIGARAVVYEVRDDGVVLVTSLANAGALSNS